MSQVAVSGSIAPTPEFPYIGLGEVPFNIPSFSNSPYNWQISEAYDGKLSPNGNNIIFGYNYPENYMAIKLPVDAYLNFHTNEVYYTTGKFLVPLEVRNSSGTILYNFNYNGASRWFKMPYKLLANTEYRLSGFNLSFTEFKFTLT